jgi:hypothetical protein
MACLGGPICRKVGEIVWGFGDGLGVSAGDLGSGLKDECVEGSVISLAFDSILMPDVLS